MDKPKLGSCFQCVFFVGIPNPQKNEENHGHCYRYPPGGVWPVRALVDKTDFCGEFREKETDESQENEI